MPAVGAGEWVEGVASGAPPAWVLCAAADPGSPSTATARTAPAATGRLRKTDIMQLSQLSCVQGGLTSTVLTRQ
ncbi:hypothetical protein GCM10009837_81540 [Streptomyces durmitorensis]